MFLPGGVWHEEHVLVDGQHDSCNVVDGTPLMPHVQLLTRQQAERLEIDGVGLPPAANFVRRSSGEKSYTTGLYSPSA